MKWIDNIVGKWPAWRGKPNIFKAVMISSCHLLVLSAPITYARPLAIAFVFLTYITLQFGLVLGYHRLLSHRCFATPIWFKRCLSLLGTLAMQNGPISWVAMHRLHHRIAEQQLDPHSPTRGLLWAHIFWVFFEHPTLRRHDQRTTIAHDLWSDPFIRFCETQFVLINLAFATGTFFAGMAFGGVRGGFAFVVWIIALRTVCLWHLTFLTNSLGHSVGYRNFNTPDHSRNVWLLGLLALGDGWHNNHHAFPSCAAHGRRPFEIDLTYRVIVVLERVGLAWNVLHPAPLARRNPQPGVSTGP